SIPRIIGKVKSGELVSKFKSAIRIEKINIKDGSNRGNTIYFGSPSSMLQVRMYEKNHEREEKGFEIEENIKVWNRTEIQLRSKRADTVSHIIASCHDDILIGTYASGILSNYLRFVNRVDDKNKTRWPISPFWKKYIG